MDWYVEHEWPDGMVLLKALMRSCGISNDGVSSPKELWGRCLSKIERGGVRSSGDVSEQWDG